MENKLNERQLKLAEYLEMYKDRWIKRQQILHDLFYIYGIDITNIYYSTSGSVLTKDIRALNESDLFEYLIISNSGRGVKIANKEELENALKKEKSIILKKLKRYWNKVDKANKNGQITYNFDESSIRVIKAFLGE
jgi:hypothetical protein